MSAAAPARGWARAAPPLLALALMLPGVAEPYGGFLAYSEAWYTLVAEGFARGSLLRPEVAPGRPDFNIPPLFAWMLHAAFALLGSGEAVARGVAILGALLGVAAVGRFAGALPALLLASTPAYLLVGRNVQPDGWSLALTLCAWAAWRERRETGSALLFALALLVKPTVLLFPFFLALQATLAARGPRWIERRHLRWAAAAAAPALAWTGVQLALHRAAFLAGLRHGEGAFEWPPLAFLPSLAAEVVFAGFPVLTLLAPAALLLRRGAAALAPARFVLLAGILIFGVMHYHGYYLVAWLPAAAVLAGALLGRRRALGLLLTLINSAAALVLLGGHKLGRAEMVGLVEPAAGATFVLDRAAYEGYWTLVARYGRPTAILTSRCAVSGPGSAVVRIPADARHPPNLVSGNRPRALAALGWGLVERPLNPHRLVWGRLEIVPAPGTWLGLHALAEEPAFAASRLPPGARACP